MNTKHLLVAGLAVALGGCEMMAAMGIGEPRTMARCTGACTVTVPVTLTDGGCKIGLSPYHKIRVAPQAQPTIIKWEISQTSDSQFKFRQSGGGVVFDKTPAPPPSVMQNGAGGGRVVTINDNHTGRGTMGAWDYTIYVTGNGNVACKLDPSVVNDDGTITDY